MPSATALRATSSRWIASISASEAGAGISSSPSERWSRGEVAGEVDEPAVEHARHLVDAVGEQEAAVEDADLRLLLRARSRRSRRRCGSSSPPELGRRRMHARLVVDERMRRGRAPAAAAPSRSVTAAPCATSTAGAMARLEPTMQPTMTPKPAAARRVAQRQRLGQAAGLVELDVDHVVPAGERGEAGAVVAALVGADRQRPRHARRAPRPRRPAAAARPSRRRAARSAGARAA